MAATITKPLEFAISIKLATIDQEEFTRVRYVEGKHLELITETRDSQIFIRETLFTEQSFNYSSQQMTQLEEDTHRPRSSIFSSFLAEEFDFVVSSKELLKAANCIQLLRKFMTSFVPIVKLNFPSADSAFFAISASLSEGLFLKDKLADIKENHILQTLTEEVVFPYAFRAAEAEFFIEMNCRVLCALIDSLKEVSQKERIKFKFLNVQDQNEIKLELSAEDDSGVETIAETSAAGAGRAPWLLECKKIDAFEEYYSYNSLKALSKMLSATAEEQISIIGGEGGELLIKVPICSNQEKDGECVIVICSLLRDSSNLSAGSSQRQNIAIEEDDDDISNGNEMIQLRHSD